MQLVLVFLKALGQQIKRKVFVTSLQQNEVRFLTNKVRSVYDAILSTLCFCSSAKKY